MIAIDKQAHALGGAVIALALGYVVAASWCALAAVLAGAIKELWDYFHPETHTVDVWDFNATAMGGLAGAIFVYLMK